jgi:hypothetical protein
MKIDMVLTLNNIEGGTANRYDNGFIILLVLTCILSHVFFTTWQIKFALTSIEI